jgi:hypothetical protein
MAPEHVLLVLRGILALGLIGFLALALYFLWSDTRRPAGPDVGVPAARLILLDGENAGAAYALDEVNLIGRAADNSILLADSTVSAYHVRLTFQGGQWWVEDLGSRNGTTVNELTLEAPMVVTYGDVVRLGRVPMRLERGEAPAALEAAP